VCVLLLGCHGQIADLKERARRSRVGLAEVEGLSDEPIRSPAGDPVGVRLRVRVRVQGGDYYLTPFLFPADRSRMDVTLLPAESLAAGRNILRHLEAGKTHEIVFDMAPSFYFYGAHCLPPEQPPSHPERFRIQIYDTRFHRQFMPPDTLPLTTETYDPAELYRGRRAVGEKVCGVAATPVGVETPEPGAKMKARGARSAASSLSWEQTDRSPPVSGASEPKRQL
jgi:hypothetical protein